MTNKFFVYGTLKVGGHFAKYFDKVRTASEPATLSGFDLYGIGPHRSAAFPGAVQGTGVIVGELHEYGKTEFKKVVDAMDSIEGYSPGSDEDSLYLRKTCMVELSDGTKEKAFVYVYNKAIRAHYEKLTDGVWRI